VFLPDEGTELYRGVGAIVLFWLAGSLHRDGDVPANLDDKRTAA